MKILIATPAYNRMVTSDYMLSVIDLMSWFQQNGVEAEVSLTQGSVLPKSRAGLASRVLHDKSFDYLLFIDSDMAFRPKVVAKLLRSKKDFCGCICPARYAKPDRLFELSRQVDDLTLSRNAAQDFVSMGELMVEDEDPKRLIRDGELFEVAKLGFGVTLLSRAVLEAIKDNYPELVLPAGRFPEYVAMGAPYEILQAFDAIQAESGLYMGEDYSFSARWTGRCGGRIWACIDEEIGHVGVATFSGTAAERLKYEGYRLD